MRGGNLRSSAVKIVGFCVLSCLLSMAVHGGISDALSAANPPSPVAPASGASRDSHPGSPPNPNSAPMPVPAPTNHYASEYGQLAVLSGSKRSNSFFTTA